MLDFSEIKTYEFLLSLGYVTLLSSIVTIALTEIIKLILKLFRIIDKGTNSTKKDIILSRTGRIVALITYAAIYVLDITVIKKEILRVDTSLITSLLSGSMLTLSISKGIYTGIRQYDKKHNIYSKVEDTEKNIDEIKKKIELHEKVETMCEEKRNENEGKNISFYEKMMKENSNGR